MVRYTTIAVQASPVGYTAELLLDNCPAEKKEALEDLDFAIKEFREMKDAAESLVGAET